MGEGRYRSLLCLVQVAVPDPDRPGEVRVEVLDPLDDRLEPGPLAGVLADPLEERLAAQGLLEWAREECRPLEESSDERSVELAFERLPRINGLDPASRAVAWELASWREGVAASQDRPVQSVLPDAALV